MNAEGARREWTSPVNGTGLCVEEAGAGAETVVFSPAPFTNRGLSDPVSDNPAIGVDPSAAEEDRQIQQVIPGSRLVTIPGAGHMVLSEQPRAATAAITEFIRACT